MAIAYTAHLPAQAGFCSRHAHRRGRMRPDPPGVLWQRTRAASGPERHFNVRPVGSQSRGSYPDRTTGGVLLTVSHTCIARTKRDNTVANHQLKLVRAARPIPTTMCRRCIIRPSSAPGGVLPSPGSVPAAAVVHRVQRGRPRERTLVFIGVASIVYQANIHEPPTPPAASREQGYKP